MWNDVKAEEEMEISPDPDDQIRFTDYQFNFDSCISENDAEELQVLLR